MAKSTTTRTTVRGKSTSKAKAETIARKAIRRDKYTSAPITADVYRFAGKAV